VLREPLAALGRADVIVVTRAAGDGPGTLDAIERIVRRHNAAAPLIGASQRAVGFRDAADRTLAAPGRAVAFCGVGNPARFRALLEALGVELAAFRAFADHHPYTPAEIRDLGRLAASHDAALVTTEKDLARLGPVALAGDDRSGLIVLRIEAVLDDERALLDRVERALAGARA
jgi:tetraacyldisaccharide 4'-kinase